MENFGGRKQDKQRLVTQQTVLAEGVGSLGTEKVVCFYWYAMFLAKWESTWPFKVEEKS